MAKRFKRKATRRLSPMAFKRVVRNKKSSSKMNLMGAIQMDSMIYGGLRAKMSNLLSPLTSKIPLGDVADEVGLGILNYLVAKNTSGMVKDIALKGLVIENARIGESIATQGLNLLSGSSTSSNGNTQPFIYG